MARAKILFLNHVAAIGGGEASLLDLLGGLDRARFEPIAVVPDTGSLADALTRADVRTLRLPMKRFRKTRNPLVLAGYAVNLLSVAWRLVRLIRRERIDLVHANSNTAQLYGGLAASWTGIPCVWHSRDLVKLGAAGRWMAARASRVVCISEAVRNQLASEGLAVNARVIPNGIDADAFAGKARNEMLRRQWGGGDATTFLVGMAGQLIPWKRQELFLEAAARIAAVIPGARFLLIGGNLFDEDAAYAAGLHTRARELGLAEKLVFSGHRADMPAVLGSLDLLIHPPAREPLGRVILETMALGKPVVAINAGGPAEIIRDGIDGVLVPPEDAGALANAAIALWRDRAAATRIGEAGRTRVRQAFSLSRHVEQMEALYAQLLGERPAEPMRVGYVVAEFPSLTETFILREMLALEQLGVEVVPFVLTKAASPLVHEEARYFLPRMRARPKAGLATVIVGLVAGLGLAPIRFLVLAGEALRRGDPDTGSRTKALYHLLGAAVLAREARRSGVRRIHAHFAHVTADVGAAMGRLLGVPFSLSAHAWDLFTRKREALAARFAPADFVAVCTRHGLEQVKDLFQGGAESRLVLLRHGLFPDRYPGARAVEPLILGVGRLVEKKGFHHLIHACRILKQMGVPFRCVMVGEGPQRHLLEEQIRQNGLNGDVRLTGPLAQERLMEWYGAARVLAVPSIQTADGDRDGLPNVLLEAMAMRIPVVASAISAIPEAVADGGPGFLVPPGNPAALAEALRRLLTDPQLRERMGGQGRATVCRDFDITRNAGKLAALWRGETMAD